MRRHTADFGDDLVRESVRKVLLLLTTAEILERQYSQHDPVFRLWLAGRQFHRGNQKTVAAAGARVDATGGWGRVPPRRAHPPDPKIQTPLALAERGPPPHTRAQFTP